MSLELSSFIKKNGESSNIAQVRLQDIIGATGATEIKCVRAKAERGGAMFVVFQGPTHNARIRVKYEDSKDPSSVEETVNYVKQQLDSYTIFMGVGRQGPFMVFGKKGELPNAPTITLEQLQNAIVGA